MKKERQILSTFLAVVMVLSLVACGSGNVPSSAQSQDEPPSTQAPNEYPSVPEEDESSTRGTVMSLTSDSRLEITRTTHPPKDPPKDGIWTVFVYLCGTDLESNGKGNASKDLKEMIYATENTSNLRFVVQAGGTREWTNEDCVSEGSTRLIISNGETQVLDSWEKENMGDLNTLTAFLDWGLENYASQYMMLDFWNHGGGSIGGVCVDELFERDRLQLDEIDLSLATVYEKHGLVFELIGFDACLMATVEMANILVPYGKYMLASQENEPGTGWDYRAFGIAVSEGCTDGIAMGQALCDGFYNSFNGFECQSNTTLSVTDLSKIDKLLTSFNAYCANVYQDICQDNTQNNHTLDMIVTNANETTHFGYSKKTGKYSNMMDLGHFTALTAGDDEKAKAVIESLTDCVVYMRNGTLKDEAGGLSIYYPLSLNGSGDVQALKNVCVTPFYLAIVDICAYGCANLGDISGYDMEQWLSTDSGYWSDEENGEEDYGHWEGDDSNILNTDPGRSAVKFEEEPHIRQYVDPEELQYADFFQEYFGAENADLTREVYTFVVTEDSVDKIQNVYYNLFWTYKNEETGKDYYMDMGQMRNCQWIKEKRRYNSILEDIWYGLPNDALLCAYPLQEGTNEQYGDYVLYTSPIKLNEEYKELRFIRVYENNSLGFSTAVYYLLGTCNSDSSDGMSDRIEPLKTGDMITPLYYAYDSETFEYAFNLVGKTYTVPVDGTQHMKWNSFLPEGDYLYSFDIEDIYGHELYTDFVTFRLDHSGVNGATRTYFIPSDSLDMLAAPSNVTASASMKNMDEMYIQWDYDPQMTGVEFEVCEFTDSTCQVIKAISDRLTENGVWCKGRKEDATYYYGVRAVKTGSQDNYSDWTTISYTHRHSAAMDFLYDLQNSGN